MAEYMDLVVVKDSKNKIVCRAPWMSHVEVGTQVRYSNGERTYSGQVIAIAEGIDNDDDNLIDLILKSAEQVKLGKLVSKMKIVDFDYEDEDDEEPNDREDET